MKMDLRGFIFSLLFAISCYEIKAQPNFINKNKHRIKSRSLIFPVTSPTRIQFIGGIGIPVEDLAYESITSGYVLKAEYFLPSKAEQMRPNYLKPQLIHRRSANETAKGSGQQEVNDRSRQKQLSANEFTSGNSLNFNESATFAANLKSQQIGSTYRWTIYRSIEMLLDRSHQPGRVCLLRSLCEHAALPLNYEGGLLSEILHIILTPSTSLDDLIKPDNQAYLRAEMLGRMGANCEVEFSECPKSPMDLISTVVDIHHDHQLIFN